MTMEYEKEDWISVLDKVKVCKALANNIDKRKAGRANAWRDEDWGVQGHYIGKLAEWALAKSDFGREHNYVPNMELLEENEGDGKIDFTILSTTGDMKCVRGQKPEVWLDPWLKVNVMNPKPTADVYVLAALNESEALVRIHGWCTLEEVLKAKIRNWLRKPGKERYSIWHGDPIIKPMSSLTTYILQRAKVETVT